MTDELTVAADPARLHPAQRLVARLCRVWGALNLLLVSLVAGPLVASLWDGFDVAGLLGGSLLPAAALLATLLLAVASAVIPLRCAAHVARTPGYPDVYWTETVGDLRRAGTVLLVLGTLAALSTAFAVLGPGKAAVAAAPAAAFFAVIFGLLLVNTMLGLSDSIRHAQVVPYFERRVGEIDTFIHGFDLARHMTEVDQDCRELGVEPLSAFGWNDDVAGEPLVWHDAGTGLATVKALLTRLEAEDLARAGQESLTADLKILAHALGRAESQGVRFCLLLRRTQVTSGQEWEVRKGSCF